MGQLALLAGGSDTEISGNEACWHSWIWWKPGKCLRHQARLLLPEADLGRMGVPVQHQLRSRGLFTEGNNKVRACPRRSYNGRLPDQRGGKSARAEAKVHSGKRYVFEFCGKHINPTLSGTSGTVTPGLPFSTNPKQATAVNTKRFASGRAGVDSKQHGRRQVTTPACWPASSSNRSLVCLYGNDT